MGKNVETMNIHDALVELKTLGKRINTEIDKMQIVGTAPANKVDSEEAHAFRVKARASLVSVADLRRRRMAIKTAVVKSNATTMVEINGRPFSIAEVIEMRKEYISELETIQSRITRALNNAKSTVESKHNEAVRIALNTMQAKSETTLTPEQVEGFKSLVAINDVVILEPENTDLSELLKGIADTLDGYNRLDSLLSTKNALTTITVEYNTGALFTEAMSIVVNPAGDSEPIEDGEDTDAPVEE